MEKDKNIKQRIVYFDILNIIAIIAVIFITYEWNCTW